MSGDSGALLEGPFLYDPYGKCFYGSTPCAPTTAVPYRFPGRRIDAETGLYYYRARYYFIGLGRFLQTDPVGYTADLNLYNYVGNDPMNREDRLGLCDDVTGCNWDVQAQLNTPESRQVQTAVMSGALDVAGAYIAPEKVAIGAAVGGLSGGLVSAYHSNSPAQIVGDAKSGAFGGATTSAGGAVFGKAGKLGAIEGEVAGAYASAEATGSTDTEAAISAGVAGLFGTVFQFTPGLAPTANEAASGAGAATRTWLRALAKSFGKAGTKSTFSPHTQNKNQNQNKSGSGRSPNFGQTIQMQGTRICPYDPSNQNNGC